MRCPFVGFTFPYYVTIQMHDSLRVNNVFGLLCARRVMTATADLHYANLGRILALLAAILAALRRSASACFARALIACLLVCHFNQPPLSGAFVGRVCLARLFGAACRLQFKPYRVKPYRAPRFLLSFWHNWRSSRKPHPLRYHAR